jgi:glycosyltransferase involved in cell wall biosynthesis
VTANLNAGGAQRSLVNLSQALSPRDSFEVAVCGISTSGRFAEDLARSGASVYRTAETRDPFDHAEAIVRRVCEARIGSVCFWNVDPKVKLLVGWALGFTRARLVDVSPGDNSFSELGGVAQFQLAVGIDSEALYRRLDALVLKYGGQPPKGCERKTKFIPNGVPVPAVRKRAYALSGPPRVAINGRIVPTKFVLEIIAAMRHVWQTIPEAELHVFGAAEPRWREYAEQVLAAAGEDAGKRILFRGPNFEAATPFTDYDAYVVAGKDQGCPNALLEAMAAGLPVVAFGDGGTAEQVKDGQTGLLVPDCSPEIFGGAIAKILADRALAERLGRDGQRHVTAAFSMRRMADNYRDIFEGLAA